MNVLRRSMRRTCFPVAVFLLLALALPSPAGAVDGVSTGGGSIQSSVCSTWTHWEGQNYDTDVAANYSPSGDVRHCVYRYKLTDSDPSAKYFMIYAESEYTLDRGDKDMDADAWIYIKSSHQAASGVYDAVDSYTSSQSCTSGFSVGLGAGPVSAEVTPKVCDSFRVIRTSRSDVGAGYNAPHVGGVRRFATAYLLKIPQSDSTTFTVTFWKPNYVHKNNGVHWIESGGPSKWETII
jgi:hypothetical protein